MLMPSPFVGRVAHPRCNALLWAAKSGLVGATIDCPGSTRDTLEVVIVLTCCAVL